MGCKEGSGETRRARGRTEGEVGRGGRGRRKKRERVPGSRAREKERRIVSGSHTGVGLDSFIGARGDARRRAKRGEWKVERTEAGFEERTG